MGYIIYRQIQGGISSGIIDPDRAVFGMFVGSVVILVVLFLVNKLADKFHF